MKFIFNLFLKSFTLFNLHNFKLLTIIHAMNCKNNKSNYNLYKK